jgi:hypothetical protein
MRAHATTETIGYTHEHELPDGSYLCLDCELTYDITPGEPMVMYYPDGSGYPGSPPTAELTSVRVTELSGEDWKLTRPEHVELFQFFDAWVPTTKEDHEWAEWFFDHQPDIDYGRED